MPNNKYQRQITLKDLDKRLALIERKINGEAQKKAERFDMLRFLSRDLHMEVESVKPVLKSNGEIELEVSYKLPKMRIAVIDGEVQLDPRIIAINALDFISYEDMAKISKAIEKYLEGKNIY